ncbi:MAG: DUF2723 domain-containing protein [candidate division WOR-3 bacterium]|nr:MAG: DUF2723 domain-containing protein [candidate division WOR-3 bacterium]
MSDDKQAFKPPSHKKINFQLPHVIAIIFFSVVLGIYIWSLCPTVYLIDSGELAAVSYTLGIAHPTGYPLYTIISFFFARLGGEPVYNLNVLSALLSATAALFLFLTARTILKNTLLALLPASLFAFAPIIWRTSLTNEVYPLTALFTLLILYCLFRMRDERHFYILMYLAGLSFTNHMMIFSLVIPVIIYAIIVYRITLPKILLGGILAFTGISLYLYLLARTAGAAELNWGNAYNLQRLLWHMTGKQYQVWMFSLPMNEIMKNVSSGLSMLLRNFLYLFAGGILAGLYYLYRHDRSKFWLFSAIIALNIAYTVNYSIPDIEAYYIPTLVAGITVFIYGVRLLTQYARWYIVIPAALIIPLINYNTCTLRGNTFGLDFGRIHIEQLPEHSTLICTYWDIYSPLIYLRHVKDIRSDIIMIDKELLRRTWYIDYLQHEYPELFARIHGSVEQYLVELYKFEYDKPYNRTMIQARFIDLLNDIVRQAPGTVYFATPVTDQDLAQVQPQLLRIPRGMVMELRSDTTGYDPFDFTQFSLSPPRSINDLRLRYNIEMVKRMALNNVRFLTITGNTYAAGQAETWLRTFSSDRK